jgi:hypothetical protein
MTTSLVQGKYILPTSEIKAYFLILFGNMFSGMIFIYKKKKSLDNGLDLKYFPILKISEENNKLFKKI